MVTKSRTTPRSICLVALGERPGNLYTAIRKAVTSQHLRCARADLEDLVVAEFVIADVSVPDPQLLYKIGVRQGAGDRTTLLICGEDSPGRRLADGAGIQVLTYRQSAPGKLTSALGRQLKLARTGKLPLEDALARASSWKPGGGPQHEKVDVFLERLKSGGDRGRQIAKALTLEKNQAIVTLDRFAETRIPLELLGVYLAYREVEAYDRMVDLHARLPEELQQTPIVREQYGFALNRLSESLAKQRNAKAGTYRKRAIRAVLEIPDDQRTSETFAILGRIFKGCGKIGDAIDAYETGFRLDPRDFYPGVNTIALRLQRKSRQDLQIVEQMIPAVRFAVDRAPAPNNELEKYWRSATKLELAYAARDWPAARACLVKISKIPAADWMKKTTLGNLTILREAWEADPVAVRELDKAIAYFSGADR